jgi:predicted ABC-type sugar transport system permease subunit
MDPISLIAGFGWGLLAGLLISIAALSSLLPTHDDGDE